jgi:pSer/pThr/pTyr-binding forkhead associated (FHA) protein
MYKLIIEDDEGKTTVVPLIRDEITIGRKEGNTIRLTERNVSRRHARLMRQNGAVYIEDLSSYNGIKVNGDRIAGRIAINEGDRVQIGDYQLALKLDKSAAAPGAPTAEVGNEKTTPFIRGSGDNGVPTSMIELQPTVQSPLPNAGMPPPGAAPAADAPARLVVVSSNFAGQEFVIDKAAVVIGRTDENDVVINHRSISRHHAKVVRENGHFHIIDLQSANGVRVNGEEYGKVELRKGDLIDLGHVRLRFVAPGEDFVFDRDAQVVDVGGGGKSKAGLFAALGVVLLLGVGGVVAWMKMGKGEGGGATAANDGDKTAKVAKLLLEADKALKGEDWDAAIGKCEEALALDAGENLARDKKKKAESEKKAKSAYEGFVAAADKSDFDSAIASFGEIPEDSIYKQKSTEKYAQVKRGYVKMHLDAAKRAKNDHKCEDARQHVEAVLTVDESNADAQDIVKSCGAVVKAPAAPSIPKQPKVSEPKVKESPEPKEPREPREPKVAKEPKATAPEHTDTPAPSGGDVAALEKKFAEAQDAYIHGQYANARDLAMPITKGLPKAWRIVGASSCFLKDKDGATKAFNKLDSQGKQFLKYVCSRNGMTVP